MKSGNMIWPVNYVISVLLSYLDFHLINQSCSSVKLFVDYQAYESWACEPQVSYDYELCDLKIHILKYNQAKQASIYHTVF